MQHFDTAVIRSGSGNSIIGKRFSHLDVTLVEDDPVFGGTCLNWGCISTKMSVVASKNARTPGHAAWLGVGLEFKGADWPVIRDCVFGRIDPISRAGREWRRKGNEVILFEDHVSFVDARTLLIGDVQISADQIVITTESRPRPLPVRILRELRSRFHASDDVMRTDELPRRLIVLGDGFVTCKFAQVFAGLGSQVTQINRPKVVLHGEDREIFEEFKQEYAKLVNLILNQSIAEVTTGPEGEMLVITTSRNGVEYEYLANAALMATGHIRNFDSLNLAAAGVKVRPGGQIRVDKHQRTSQPHIWALGDVSSDRLFKHVASAEAHTVAANPLIDGGELAAADHRYIPHAVFTEPQIAAVGTTGEQPQGWGTPYVELKQRYADVAFGRALEDEGCSMKLLTDPRTWYLLGARITGPQTATLVQPVIQAMSFGQTVQELARDQYWIHPALTEVLENALLGLLKAPRPKELDA